MMKHIKPWFSSRQGSPASSTESPYTYSPLEQGQIRTLLVSLSAGRVSRLQCQFRVVNLEENSHPFTAISYTWGPPVFDHKIWFGSDRYLSVTKSASAALHDLAKTNPGRLYWIDAVCINQNDLVEKGQQVKFMYSVYLFAGEVLAFPSDQIEDAAAAARFVHELGSWMQRADMRSVTAADLLQKFKWPSRDWTALTSLLEQKFFLRVWIVQEMVAAKTTRIRCGRANLNWELLAFVVGSLQGIGCLGLLRQAQSGLNAIAGGALATTYVSSIRHLVKAKGKLPPLSFHLLTSSTFETSDQRDRIFALRNISSDGSGAAFEPDYTKPKDDVFVQSTVHLLCHQSALCILSAAGVGIKRLNNHFPSWVPDWSAVLNGRIMGQMVEEAKLFSDHDVVYQACGPGMARSACSPANSLGRYGISYDEYTNSIRLNIRVIDTVNHIPSPRPKLPFQSDFTQARIIHAPLLSWLEEISQLLPPRNVYRTGENCFPDTLARTLVAGIDPQREKTSLSIPSQFLDFIAVEYLLVKDNPYEKGRSGDVETKLPERAKQRIRDVARSTYSKAEATLFSSTLRQSKGEVAFMPQETVTSMHFFTEKMVLSITDRRLFTTSEGFLGFGHEFMKPGDLVCLIYGAQVPFLLRPRDLGGYFLVGECYVHGLMYGEGMKIGSEREVQLF